MESSSYGYSACICHGRMQKKRVYSLLGPFNMYSEHTEKGHSSLCSLYRGLPIKGGIKYRARLTVLSRTVEIAIGFTFDASFGAGGQSISPPPSSCNSSTSSRTDSFPVCSRTLTNGGSKFRPGGRVLQFTTGTLISDTNKSKTIYYCITPPNSEPAEERFHPITQIDDLRDDQGFYTELQKPSLHRKVQVCCGGCFTACTRRFVQKWT